MTAGFVVWNLEPKERQKETSPREIPTRHELLARRRKIVRGYSQNVRGLQGPLQKTQTVVDIKPKKTFAFKNKHDARTLLVEEGEVDNPELSPISTDLECSVRRQPNKPPPQRQRGPLRPVRRPSPVTPSTKSSVVDHHTFNGEETSLFDSTSFSFSGQSLERTFNVTRNHSKACTLISPNQFNNSLLDGGIEKDGYKVFPSKMMIHHELHVELTYRVRMGLQHRLTDLVRCSENILRSKPPQSNIKTLASQLWSLIPLWQEATVQAVQQFQKWETQQIQHWQRTHSGTPPMHVTQYTASNGKDILLTMATDVLKLISSSKLLRYYLKGSQQSPLLLRTPPVKSETFFTDVPSNTMLPHHAYLSTLPYPVSLVDNDTLETINLYLQHDREETTPDAQVSSRPDPFLRVRTLGVEAVLQTKKDSNIIEPQTLIRHAQNPLRIPCNRPSLLQVHSGKLSTLVQHRRSLEGSGQHFITGRKGKIQSTHHLRKARHQSASTLQRQYQRSAYRKKILQTLTRFIIQINEAAISLQRVQRGKWGRMYAFGKREMAIRLVQTRMYASIRLQRWYRRVLAKLKALDEVAIRRQLALQKKRQEAAMVRQAIVEQERAQSFRKRGLYYRIQREEKHARELLIQREWQARRDSAILIVQCAMRRTLAIQKTNRLRNEIGTSKQRVAVILIQAVVRGYLTRRRILQRGNLILNLASTRIQSTVRGHLVRIRSSTFLTNGVSGPQPPSPRKKTEDHLHLPSVTIKEEERKTARRSSTNAVRRTSSDTLRRRSSIEREVLKLPSVLLKLN